MMSKKTGKNLAPKKKARTAGPPENQSARPAERPSGQAAVNNVLLPGAWLSSWMVRIAESTDAAYVLAWLLGVRLAGDGPALGYLRDVQGETHIAILKRKLADHLGLTTDDLQEAIDRLRGKGLVSTKVRADGGKKTTFFLVNLDAVRTAKNEVCASEEEAT
jgi:hypothetical protein